MTKIRELFLNEVHDFNTDINKTKCFFNYTVFAEKLFITKDTLSESIPKEKWQEFAESLKSGVKVSWMLQDTVHFTLEFDLHRGVPHSYNFQELEKKITEGAKNLLKPTIWSFNERKSDSGEVDCYGVPVSIIDYNKIEIFCQKNDTSLTSINKMIGPSCKSILFKDAHYIKSNVLGLLKLPKNCNINWSSNEDTLIWTTINN